MRKFDLTLLPLSLATFAELEGTYIGAAEPHPGKSRNQLWESTQDFIAKNNLTIKETSNETGIITVVFPDLYPKYSDKKREKLKDPLAYVAMEHIRVLDPRGINLLSISAYLKTRSSVKQQRLTFQRICPFDKWRTYPECKVHPKL